MVNIFVIRESGYFLDEQIAKMKEFTFTNFYFGHSRIKNLLLLRKQIRNQDIIFLDFAGYPALTFFRLIKKITKPIVIRIHRYEFYGDFLSHIPFDKIDKILVVSDYFKQKLIQKYPECNDKVDILYNGVDMNVFYPYPNVLKNDEFVSIGSSSYLKRFYEMAELWQGYQRPLTFIGKKDHDPSYYAMTMDFVNLHKLPIAWIDNISHDKLPQKLCEFSFYLNNAISESFGVAIVESMACGLVPLIRAWPGIEYLFPEKYLFSTCREFHEKMELYLSYTEDDILKEGKVARNYVKQRYSMDDQVQKMKEIFNKVVQTN